MKGAELDLLDDDAAVRMHDGFRQPRGARGIHHPQRMIEGYMLDLQRRIAFGRGCPGHAAGELGSIDRRIEARQQHHVIDTGQFREQLMDQRAAVVRLAAEMVAVDCDQHLRRDLAETVEYRDPPHVGRAGRPDGAQAGDRKEGHGGFRDVRQIGHHAVAAPDAHAAQAGGQRANLALQFGPAQLAIVAGLVARHDSRAILRGMAEDLVDVVHCHAGKPLRAGHPRIGQDSRARHRRRDREVVPDGAPETFEIIHRPAPEGIVVGEPQSARGRQPFRKGGDLRRTNRRGRWLPRCLQRACGIFHA